MLRRVRSCPLCMEESILLRHFSLARLDTFQLTMTSRLLMLVCLVNFCTTCTAGTSTSTFSGLRFAVEPVDTIVTAGRPARLDCLVAPSRSLPAGTATAVVPELQWIKDSSLISFDSRRSVLSNGSLYFANVERGHSHRPDEGVYQCLATVRGIGTIVSRKAVVRLSYLESHDADSELQNPLELQRGDRVMFPCLIRGLPTPRVRWYRNDVEVSIGSEQKRIFIHDDGILEIGDVESGDSGRYKCRAEFDDDSRFSQPIHLMVDNFGRFVSNKMAPRFIMKPKDRVVAEGANVLLHCAANGRDRNLSPPSIVWLRDGSTIDLTSEKDRISIVGASSLHIKNVKRHDSALYTCRALNLEDSIDGDATLSVEVPPKIVSSTKDMAAPANTDIELSCSAVGVPTPVITWLKNGDSVIPSDYFQVAESGSLRILGLLPSDAGMYQCVATSSVGNMLATVQLVVLFNGSVSSRSAPTGVPGTPLDLAAAHVSVRFITLTWKAPAQYGSSPVTGYSIFWKEVVSDRERVLNTTTLEVDIQQLRPATRYEFRLVAWNQLGPSQQAANIVTETLPEALVPDAPINILATAVSTTSIHVRWDSPVNTNGPIVTYKVYYYSPDDQQGEQDVNVDGTEFILTDLAKFRQYIIRVVAYNANGPGTATSEVTCRTFSDVPSHAPQNVSAEAASSTSILVRWEPPPDDMQNGILTGYKIRYRRRGDRMSDTITTDGSMRVYDITGLERNTEYDIRVQALTVNGSGPASLWFSVETFANDLDETTVPGQPTTLLVQPQSNSIGVSWTAPVEQGIMVRGYVIGYGIGIPDVYRQVLEPQQRYHVIRALRTSSEYVISLRAFNNVGEGPPIYETTFTREETTPEPLTPMMPPVGVKAVILSPTSALLVWTDTSLGRSQRPMDGRHYVIRYNPKLVRKQRLINVTDLSTHLDDLRPDTEYEFSIKVVKGQRQSTWSLSVFNRTQEAAPSTAPRDLEVTAVDGRPSWASLSWQAPRLANGQITGYVVLYTTDATQPDREWLVEAVMGERTSATVRDLMPRSTYYFKVQARNSIGNGPLSPTVIFQSAGYDGSSHGLGNEALTYGSNDQQTGGGSVPMFVLWILIACVSGVSVIAAAIVIAVVCRRRTASSKRTNTDDEANETPKPGPKDLKPPDLWIHDQVDRRRTSHASNSANSADAAPSIAGSQDVDDTVSLDTVQEDERYRRPTIRPLMIPIDHPPQPRDPLALIKPNGHLTSPESSSFTGIGGVRTGLFPRPSALQFSHNTPRVNAGDLCQPSLQADYALSTLERHRMMRESQKQLGSNQRLAVRPTAQRLPTTSSASAIPSVLGGKTRSPLPTLLSRSPDVTLRSENIDAAAPAADMTKSVSTEELTAEMANLEGLMKDLNAITQHEFQC